MTPPGVFLKPSTLSTPLNAVRRSRSPSVSSMSRSISTERPGTPRPSDVNDVNSSFKYESIRRRSMPTPCSSVSLMKNYPFLSPIAATSAKQFSRPLSYSSKSSRSATLLKQDDEQRFSEVQGLLSREEALKLDFYSKFTPTSVSLSHFLEHNADANAVEKSFLFLRREVPVRLSNIMKELELLPQDLLSQPACEEILNQYSQSFREVLVFENMENNAESHGLLNKFLTELKVRHQDTVPRMAEALHNMRDAGNLNVNCKDRMNIAIQYFLDRLYMSRISIHMLISHYKAAYCPEEADEKDVVSQGTIDPCCNVVTVAKAAYDSAAFLCEQIYMDAPKLNIEAKDLTDSSKDGVEFVYISTHLYHIFFEVFKNSMRATMEFHEDSEELPEITVRITKSTEDISIKISDCGGGISRSVAENCFLYLYTSASRVKLTGNDMGGTTSTSTPMHGLGYGLPLSKLYARYFGGDMKMASCDGHGTDMYIYLKALEKDARETLPVYNVSSSNKLKDVANQVEDWTKED